MSRTLSDDLDGEALHDDAAPVVNEGGGIAAGMGADMSWFSARLSWRASRSYVRGRCACCGARCEGEGEVEGRLRLAQRGSESGDDGGRARLGMCSEGRGDKQRAVGALMLSYGGDVEDGLALH